MYMRLLYYANNARYKASGGEWVFRKWVEIRSRDLIKDMGKDRNAMRRVREELVKAGYIKYKPGIGNGTTEYMLCLLVGGKKEEQKPTEAYRSLPKPTNQPTAQGSFDTDDFFEAAIRKTFGEDL